MIYLAHRITKSKPNYDGYSNNCQNFVHYLLTFACPGCMKPKTIQDVLSPLFGTVEYEPRSVVIPGTYPRSSTVPISSDESGTWYSAIGRSQSMDEPSAKSTFESMMVDNEMNEHHVSSIAYLLLNYACLIS